MPNHDIADDEQIVTNDNVDLSRASYTPSLSSTGIDDERQLFHVTLDKVTFKTPVEVISTVLHANGYDDNLENILACLDDFKLGAKGRLKNKTSQSAPKSFLPCIQFRLPNKSLVGSTLQKFYDEIDGYESTIAKLNDKPGPKKAKTKSVEELQAQIKKLEAQNKLLKSEKAALSDQLNRAIKSEASANSALVSQNILPAEIRLGVVKGIDINSRSVLLKSGRTNINFPLVLANILPAEGDHCLLHIRKGNVLGGFFYNSKGKKLEPSFAEIVFAKGKSCKFRDKNRNMWVLEAQNEDEEELFKRFNRGDPILVYFLEGQILKVSELTTADGNDYGDKIEEVLVRHQLLVQQTKE